MEDAHCSADGVPVRLRANQAKTDAAVRCQLIVTEEKGRSVVRGHQNVEISVTIEVGVRQTTADLWLVESSACLGSHIAEGPISLVEKKLWRLGVTNITSGVPYRFIDLTVGGTQVKCAVAHVSVELVGLRVVGHEQIGPAVLVIVEHRYTQRLRTGVENAARCRDVFKCPVTAIAEEPAGFSPVCLGGAVGLVLSV